MRKENLYRDNDRQGLSGKTGKRVFGRTHERLIGMLKEEKYVHIDDSG
jgi:hypothetical protein